MTSLALIWFGAFLAVWSLCRYMSNVWVSGRPLHLDLRLCKPLDCLLGTSGTTMLDPRKPSSTLW